MIQRLDSPGPPEPCQIGFAVGKKVGKAVVRNLIKRRLREILRTVEPDLSPGILLVVRARARAAEAPFRELRQSTLQALHRAGVIRPDPGRAHRVDEKGSGT